MQILFAIAILCCCALVFAAVSVARHIRKAHCEEPRVQTPSFKETLLRAGYSDPPVGGRKLPFRPTPEDLAAGRMASRNTGFLGERRPPTSAQHSIANDVRADWKYFNRSAGDLSGPDTHKRHGILPASQRKRT